MMIAAIATTPLPSRRGRRLLLGIVSAAGLFSLGAPFLHAQGSLTPPGAPAATMKTLQQVEPRVDLQAPDAPGVTATDAAYHFIITQPGSYYLSGNLGVTKPNGIQISAEGVTLDLNGFEISRASGSGGYGINISGVSHRATVRNGSIKGFSYGIYSNFVSACAFRDLAVSDCTHSGINVAGNAILESCRVYSCSGTYGISADFGASLSNCTAYSNSVTYAIFVDEGSSLINCTAAANVGSNGFRVAQGCSLNNCTAVNNSVSYGISLGTGSTLLNCTAEGNTGPGSTSAGIYAAFGCTISNCSSTSNSSTAETPSATTGIGFLIAGAALIRDCTAQSNLGDGIRITSDGYVRGNMCIGNGSSTGDGAGICVTGTDNRIEDNSVTDNDRGIDVDASGNVIIKNSASGNSTNYDITGINDVGPIGSAATATSPWANIAF